MTVKKYWLSIIIILRFNTYCIPALTRILLCLSFIHFKTLVMKPKINRLFIWALGISLIFLSCNNKDKKAEPASTNNDTTGKMTTMTDNTAQNQAMDALTVAPALYKLVKDTMGIRVVEVTYKPGDSSALHWHPNYVVYATQGGTATFYGKDGAKMVNEMKTGMTMVRPGEYHSVKNTGKTTIKVMLVEVNRTGQMTSTDAAMDATKVSPELYKLKNDTLGIRVIEVNYKPGQSSGMHSHPDVALYVIDPGTGEFTGKDGTKRVLNLEKGMTMIVPADTHTVKNTGKTTLKAILVEVNQAMK